MPSIVVTLPAFGEDPYYEKLVAALKTIVAGLNDSLSADTPRPLGPVAVAGSVGGLGAPADHVHPRDGLATQDDLADAIIGAGSVPSSRTIATGAGLTGGGDLTSNRSLSVVFGSTAGTAVEGNDARLTGGSASVTPTGQLAAVGGAATLAVVGGLPPYISAAGVTIATDDTAAGPGVSYAAAATSGTNVGLISPLGVAQRRWNPYLAARIATDPSAITTTRLVVGLVSTDLAAGAGPASTGAFTGGQGAWFRYDSSVDGSAFWRCVTASATNATVTTTSTAIAANTSYQLVIDVDETTPQIRFQIGGSLVATHTTNLPVSSTALAYTARLRTLAAAARALRLGRISWSLR